MWPIPQVKRKNFKLYLNPEVYTMFRLLCKRGGRRRINHVVEAFMVAALHNPFLIQLVCSMAEKYAPNIFHEPTEKERLMEKARKIIDEAEKLLS